MRIASPRQMANGGYLHGQATRLELQPAPGQPYPDLSQLARDCSAALTTQLLARLIHQTGLTSTSLRRLGVGWLQAKRAWTFPMTTAGRICGIKLRLQDGRKLSVKGGRDGLFIPQDLARFGDLYVCEGPTDTAALLGLGLQAVGRPSCAGCHAQVAALAPGRRVVVVADSDEPGQRGAARLAESLRGLAMAVSVLTPPGYKDAREWVASGATAGQIGSFASSCRPEMGLVQRVRPIPSSWIRGVAIA